MAHRADTVTVLRAEVHNLQSRLHDMHMALRDAQRLVARGDTIDSLRRDNARLEEDNEKYRQEHARVTEQRYRLEDELLKLRKAIEKPKWGSYPKLVRENDELRRQVVMLTVRLDNTKITHNTMRRMSATLATIETAAISASAARSGHA